MSIATETLSQPERPRKVVTVEVEGLTLGGLIALYHLIRKLGEQHNLSDVCEVECSIRMGVYSFVGSAPNAEGLKRELENLEIDAFISEATI